MFGMGIQEIALVLVIAVVIIGPKHLPHVARTLGKVFTQFKRTSNELRTMVQDEVGDLDNMNPLKELKNTIESEVSTLGNQSRDYVYQWDDSDDSSTQDTWPDTSIADSSAVAAKKSTKAVAKKRTPASTAAAKTSGKTSEKIVSKTKVGKTSTQPDGKVTATSSRKKKASVVKTAKSTKSTQSAAKSQSSSAKSSPAKPASRSKATDSTASDLPVT